MMPRRFALAIDKRAAGGAGVIHDRVGNVYIAGVGELEDPAPASQFRVSHHDAALKAERLVA